jgi:GNAT superfamily N-acetyltransferase
MAAKKKKKTKKVENQNIAEMEQPAVGVSDQAKVDVEERLAKNGIVLQICKREHYIEAWKAMYALDKKKWNDPMFDDVNPMLNKTPLGTEVENFCVVAYDGTVEGEQRVMGLGKPVGIFCMVVTERNGKVKPIGKQFITDPEYQGKGIGKAMLLVLEKELKDHGHTWYYIGCSKMSAGILRQFGQEPYESDEAHDMYKFNVDLNCDGFGKVYQQLVNDAGFELVR